MNNLLKGVLLFTLMLIVPTARCEVSLKDIYQASKNAIENGSIAENIAVVARHYLTHQKENSAWFVAEETARDMFNIPMGMEDLKFIEKLLFSVGRHFEQCVSMKPSRERAQCFFHLAPLVLDLETGSRWLTLPEISIELKAKFGTMYNTIALLISHLALIAKENFQVFEDPILTQFKLHGYRKALENVNRMLHDFDVDIINWRVDAVSPPIICEITQKFWKEFVGVCETRWRRSIDINDEPDTNKKTFIGVAENGDVISEEDEYKTREDDTILNSADRIGTSCAQNCIQFRVQVVDTAIDKVLYENYKYTAKTAKAETMNMLVTRANIVRGDEANKIKHKVTKLANDTFTPNGKMIIRALAMLKE